MATQPTPSPVYRFFEDKHREEMDFLRMVVANAKQDAVASTLFEYINEKELQHEADKHRWERK